VNAFKKAPIASLVAWGTVVLGVLIVLQTSGILTGTAAHYVDAAAGALQVVLTAYARRHVTPVVDPKDNLGRQLVPASLVPGRGISKPGPF
jgi:hypothetical protein